MLALTYMSSFCLSYLSPHCQHQSCNLCPLYADTTAADKVRVTNAAKKAARQVRKDVNVDVDALLKDPGLGGKKH